MPVRFPAAALENGYIEQGIEVQRHRGRGIPKGHLQQRPAEEGLPDQRAYVITACRGRSASELERCFRRRLDGQRAGQTEFLEFTRKQSGLVLRSNSLGRDTPSEYRSEAERPAPGNEEQSRSMMSDWARTWGRDAKVRHGALSLNNWFRPMDCVWWCTAES